MLKQAPVLLQETKWNQANLQYLSHTWPDIKVVTTLAKQNPKEQAGVAILFPPGWKVQEEKALVKHYAVAAISSLHYLACLDLHTPQQSQVFCCVYTTNHPCVDQSSCLCKRGL